MNGKTITLQELRALALERDYVLKSLPPTVLATRDAVLAGACTASKLAASAGILRSTASERLRAAKRLGVLDAVKPPGHEEMIYMEPRQTPERDEKC